jgi:DNA repair exonuclease SbcCD nuclease subunit
MKLIITSDLHLTHKPEDEYRWGLFPWLEKQVVKHKVDAICILGDLTDAKDRHSSELVNKIMDHLYLLGQACSKVIILAGNHDFIHAENPFFEMSQYLEGVSYIKKKQIVALQTGILLAVPFHRKGIQDLQFTKAEWTSPLLLTHQTFSGAVASNGMKMKGESQEIFAKYKGDIISGDIHVPQDLNRVTYVGAPYRIRFNDTFKPRVLLYNQDRGKVTFKNLYFKTLHRHTMTLRSPEELRAQQDLLEGDQVKVRLRLRKSQYSEWTSLVEETKNIGKELGVTIHGVELEKVQRRKVIREPEARASVMQPAEILEKFCVDNKIDEYRQKIGGKLL